MDEGSADTDTVVNGKVIWITGLSGAGKTTLGLEIAKQLRSNSQNVVFLDGDELRSVLGDSASYTRSDRLKYAYIYGRLCKLLSEQGLIVVVATIALFAEIHQWNRENIGGYLEVFLDVPLSELRKRDHKGIYEKFDKGLLKNVAGLDLSVDFPLNPNFHFKYDPDVQLHEIVGSVIATLMTRPTATEVFS